MTISIGNYTTSDKARAVAGVTDNEVRDTVISDMDLAEALAVDLYGWLPTHATVWADGDPSGSPTPAQTQGRSLLAIYASRFCALEILISSMHIPQQVGNGKDVAKRFTDDALEEAKNDLRAKLTALKADLLELIEPTVIEQSGLFARVSPAVDPVTLL